MLSFSKIPQESNKLIILNTKIYNIFNTQLALDLLKKMLKLKPNERICTEDASTHPYFKDYLANNMI